MDYRNDIGIYTNNDKSVNVVIEIPMGSRNKYEIDEVTGSFLKIVRTLHKKYSYIFNYGFIPRTYEEDHDQLDAIVIDSNPIDPLTVVECKVIGVVKTIDEGKQDDKILCIPKYSDVSLIDLRKIIKFLKNYKYPDQATTIIGDILSANEAHKIISESAARYSEYKLKEMI